MDRSTMSDERALVKKLVAEHEPDEAIDYNAKLLLRLVEDILHSTSSSGHDSRDDRDEDKILQSSYNDILGMLSFKINRISCEFSYKADAHSTAVSIFEMVRNYKWDVKLVLALAAFSLTYGEIWLLACIHKTNQLAKPMAILKHLPDTLKDAGQTKPFFDALNSLFGVILNVIKCVIEFNDLPLSYITPDLAAYSTASSYIPIASYWTIRGIVACATKITSLGHLSASSAMQTESWELATFAHKLKNTLDHLRKQLDSCYSHIEKKRDDEAYRILVELFKMSHPDNMKILRALIYAKDDILPLFDGVTKKMVRIIEWKQTG
ncbi:hypothetical protein L6164_005044 [Bauhinia variegata]|uniref:Uncharacterized protein n=1 Tax=Bauhinia variegata TaxID=167791 RepID=A0ACB9PRY4_BAUVA|nr:hypothetical protein L6164_005044 [Bauhinia variegata]